MAVDSQRQDVDVGLLELAVEFEHLVVGGKAAAGLYEDVGAVCELVGDEQVLAGVFDEIFDLAEVEVVDVLVVDDDVTLFLQ